MTKTNFGRAITVFALALAVTFGANAQINLKRIGDRVKQSAQETAAGAKQSAQQTAAGAKEAAQQTAAGAKEAVQQTAADAATMAEKSATNAIPGSVIDATNVISGSVTNATDVTNAISGSVNAAPAATSAPAAAAPSRSSSSVASSVANSAPSSAASKSSSSAPSRSSGSAAGLSPIPTSGTFYYVSAETGGSVRTADGTKAKPFKDLQAALDKAEAGSTILIATGNYLGTSDRGYIEMPNAVNLIGGYSTDFSKRDVLAYPTKIQPSPEANGTSSSFALLNIGKKGGSASLNITGTLLIDGLILDRGNSNAYHPEKGKPEGVATGMLLFPPTEGTNNGVQKVKTVQNALLWFDVAGKLVIQNCTFSNSAQYAIMGNAGGANIAITNNVFVSNAFAAVQIVSKLKTGDYSNRVDFAYNTVLFNWNRTADNMDLGLGSGYRFMTGVSTDVHHNIIGLSHRAGLDRTRTETPANEKLRKTGAEDNYFFLNKMGDIELPGGGMGTRVWCKNFEDREELYKYERNQELGNNAGGFKGILNTAYLEGFLNATYSESTDYNENSSANQFRSAMGMNKQGAMTTKVSMYGNRYPLDDAIKLFGAVNGKGAQTIKNEK